MSKTYSEKRKLENDVESSTNKKARTEVSKGDHSIHQKEGNNSAQLGLHMYIENRNCSRRKSNSTQQHEGNNSKVGGEQLNSTSTCAAIGGKQLNSIRPPRAAFCRRIVFFFLLTRL
ncbi:hypothetical protein NPIL_418291 [Nephila pilipes]|uniref:Uncharacterized protein n=1 Tax=Nephila pilipes TaxID=299642 RepID=A0A8X6PTY9_NEPPI|nr:hypothetical protein NPIL_418291 [Nephila pilipes]